MSILRAKRIYSDNNYVTGQCLFREGIESSVKVGIFLVHCLAREKKEKEKGKGKGKGNKPAFT